MKILRYEWKMYLENKLNYKVANKLKPQIKML